jgi:hypothetical protein
MNRCTFNFAQATDPEIAGIWSALGRPGVITSWTEIVNGVTMEEWCELVYAEMSARGLPTT